MYFTAICKDEATGENRRRQRAAHLEFVSERQHQIVFGGPLIVEGKMIGSLFIFDLPDRAGLDAYMAEDPYFTENVFASVEIYETRWMVPEREAGFLAEEASRARDAAREKS